MAIHLHFDYEVQPPHGGRRPHGDAERQVFLLREVHTISWSWEASRSISDRNLRSRSLGTVGPIFLWRARHVTGISLNNSLRATAGIRCSLDPSDPNTDPEEHVAFVVTRRQGELGPKGLAIARGDSERGKEAIEVLGLASEHHVKSRGTLLRYLEMCYLQLRTARRLAELGEGRSVGDWSSGRGSWNVLSGQMRSTLVWRDATRERRNGATGECSTSTSTGRNLQVEHYDPDWDREGGPEGRRAGICGSADESRTSVPAPSPVLGRLGHVPVASLQRRLGEQHF